MFVRCVDGRPDDPFRTEPGVCGCGTVDKDGIFDCIDDCPFSGNPNQADIDGDACCLFEFVASFHRAYHKKGPSIPLNRRALVDFISREPGYGSVLKFQTTPVVTPAALRVSIRQKYTSLFSSAPAGKVVPA